MTYKQKIPFFSVIITTFNRATSVVNALDSVLEQSFTNFEVIIVDDGSTDDTFCRLKSYIDSNKNVFYFYQENKKQSEAKNLGIRKAKGVYFTFLDSDDTYHKNHLFTRYTLLSNENIDLLHGGVEIIGNQYVPDIYDNQNLIHLSECVIGGTFFIKGSLIAKIGFFDRVDYGDDTCYFNKCISSKLIIGKTNIKTYIYNRNSLDSICNIIVNQK